MKKIDIGCGPKPQKGYDAYTDIYLPRQIAIDPEMESKFVKTPLEDMGMFKDKEFDFAFCHHVIEHVQDPNRACAEIARIAKSGVLYFPTAEVDILIGRRDHNWLVFPNYEKKHLLFIRKKFKSYFGQASKKAIVPKEARKWIALQHKPFKWKDSFEWTVVK